MFETFPATYKGRDGGNFQRSLDLQKVKQVTFALRTGHTGDWKYSTRPRSFKPLSVRTYLLSDSM